MNWIDLLCSVYRFGGSILAIKSTKNAHIYPIYKYF